MDCGESGTVYIHGDGFWHGSWNFAFGQDFRSYRVRDRTQRLGMFNTDVFSPQDTSLIDSDATISTKLSFCPNSIPSAQPPIIWNNVLRLFSLPQGVMIGFCSVWASLDARSR